MLILKDLLHKINKNFPDSEINLEDVFGDGRHYRLTIISQIFNNLTLIDQHKIVYKALSADITNDKLHALSIKTIKKNI